MLLALGDPALAPFTVALMVMVAIALLEGVGLLFGLALSSFVDQLMPDLDVDADLDLDADIETDGASDVVIGDVDGAAGGAGPFVRFLGWLQFGKVPALVLLIVLLTSFAVVGLVLQWTLKSVVGFYLWAPAATIAALTVALPVTRGSAGFIAKVFPKEKTEAVSQDSFVGRVAVVTGGTARAGLPAQARLKDQFGQSHYILAEPDTDQEEFPTGSEVLIIARAGSRFRVIANPTAALSSVR